MPQTVFHGGGTPEKMAVAVKNVRLISHNHIHKIISVCCSTTIHIANVQYKRISFLCKMLATRLAGHVATHMLSQKVNC